ncbi:MAG: ABC transporter permease [Bacillota bacterium]|jgi:NitT/TauT family transport system permease protein|nr:ABC transporter permease [Bacillota bacterium]NLL26653.1 ABC transporter permease [Erysipelotrichia bacterium]
MKKKLNSISIIIFWLILWEITASVINKPYIFASFTDTLAMLFSLLSTKVFWISIFKTVIFTIFGFLSAFIFGLFFAIFSYKISFFKSFINPVLFILKSVPVASIIVIILLWFGSKYLSIYISFIVVFPQFYYAILSGLQNVNKEILEVAEIFRFSFHKKVLYIYRLSITPFLKNSISTACSLAFKSSVTAEIIGNTINTIGEQIYYSKIYLNSASLFSYSFVLIIIAYSFEKIIIQLINKLGGKV